MKFLAFCLIIIETICSSVVVQRFDLSYNCAYCQPEQIHIAYGEKPNEILITWSTMFDTGESLVEFGAGTMERRVAGWRTQFVDGRGQWIHRALLTDLQYDTKYVYQCGSQYGWSEQLWFRTPPAGDDWVVRAAIFGDMGVQNAQSLPYLANEAARSKFDVIIHAGDFAYDMHEQDSRVGDDFMRMIQPLASNVPYMTCPGNHEENRNFSNYRHRFSMPRMNDTESLFYSWDLGPVHFVAINTEAYYFLNYGASPLVNQYQWNFSNYRNRFSMPRMNETESLFYSWDLGPVHFVAINTEAYYFLNYGAAPLVNQYQWLEMDLEVASRPENRHHRPWLVIIGHRPMYCSNSDDFDCTVEYTRKGLLGMLGLEPLLKKYGVDLAIWAHEHSYERTWPLYDYQVYNGSYQQPYVNPRAPVHLVTGSAGCREGRDHFKNSPQSWSAFRSQDFGYTRFKAYNKTHINIEQVLTIQTHKCE